MTRGGSFFDPLPTRQFSKSSKNTIAKHSVPSPILCVRESTVARKAGLAPGKLPPAMMVKLLNRLRTNDPSVKLGPAMGEDAAAIKLGGDRYLISKTDPITFTAHGMAALLMRVNANDLATRGALPRYMQVAALFPPGTIAATVSRCFAELQAEAKKLGVTITGGHTEVTDAVTRPVLVGHMLGFATRHQLISTADTRPGDVLVMAGAAGIEGSAILAGERGPQIARALGEAARLEAERLAIEPGTSVTRPARIAAALGAHAMHDPTEGGIGAAIHEMAYAAGLRVTVHLERVLVLGITRQICDLLRIDPLGLTSSGALLVAIDPRRAERLVNALQKAHIPASQIGRFEAGRGVKAILGGKVTRLPWFERDEIVKVISPPRSRALRTSVGRAK
jgi:hydrogenase expression/formation protein HypE